MFKFEQLIGSKLLSLIRICDLIKIDLVTERDEVICIHSQSSLLRFFKSNKLIVSSEDMFLPGINYVKKRNNKFSYNIPEITLFDDEVKKYLNEIIGLTVLSINLQNNDLNIFLKNNFSLNICPNTLEQNTENYRVFIKGDLNSHFVVEND